MTTDHEPDLPDTAMATGNDYDFHTAPTRLDPDERALLTDLRNPTGADVVETAEEERPEYAAAVDDETLPTD